jgi:organic hydroperoxide reductase OsmC/OhrA
MKTHKYEIKTEWTGNQGDGTLNYSSYLRDHVISGAGKYGSILASSDSAFSGDPARFNPEDLFVSSLSACHMLWYLHLCSQNGVVVTQYTDEAVGLMIESENGSGRFSKVTLNPNVIVEKESQIDRAIELHEQANAMCFIANSCNFDVEHVVSCTAR